MIVLLNIVVSIFLIRRDDLEPFQKGAQTFVVWLVPILGAVIMRRVNKSHDSDIKRKKAFGSGAISLGGYDSAGDGGGSD
jgi:hypothetical protein